MKVIKGILSSFLIVSQLSLFNGEGISCFHCTVAPEPGVSKESNKICSHFEENKHFQVFCPKSTMCMKRTTYYKLINGTIIQTSVERGCALQLETKQVFNKSHNKWQYKETVIPTAYELGCFIGEDRGSPGGPPDYCYCDYQLCNISAELHRDFFLLGPIIAMTVLIQR